MSVVEETSADRVKELRAFDDTKAGVKGLVDSGIQTVPEIFIRPPENRVGETNSGESDGQRIPVIDLGAHNRREEIVEEVKRAARDWGFFQVVNHGVPPEVLEGMVEGIRGFHEQDGEVKKQFHSREMGQKVKYGSNVDLYRSRAANWRDSLTISLSMMEQIEPHELPEICRDLTINYINHVTSLGHTLFELLSEALGLKPDHLGGVLECTMGRTFIGHYYPACPEPELTIGASEHSDPSFLTVLLEDQIGGLQVLHDNRYIDVQPLKGSLVVNIGDMLQIITNNEFISMNHRVLANKVGPRISVAGFFKGCSAPDKIYAPIEELVSEKRPARYKEFTVREYMSKFFQRPIDKSGLDEFKLH